MKKNNITTNSKSKQKRIDRQTALAKEARAKKMHRAAAITGCAGVIALIAGGSVLARNAAILKYLASDIEQETSYSAYLTNSGKIEGTKVSDYIDPIDISSITLNKDDVEFTDEDVDSYVDSLLEEYKTLDTESTDRTAETGDTVNIDYVGTIDGTEFDGGSADGYDLELGSGSFIDDFEDQLVGAKIGDDVTVSVTFPEDYGDDDLNGKDAEFAVHVNGIYETGEFTDEFVQENLSDYGYDTAEKFKEAYKEEQLINLYYNAMNDWIEENVTPDDLPAVYLHHAKGLTMTNDELMFNQYKTMYEQYGLDFDFDSYQDYYTTDDQTYEEVRDEEASKSVIRDLVYQSIYENENLKVTNDDYKTFLTYNGIDDDTVDAYGKPYIMKSVLQNKVVEYLIGKVTLEEASDEEAVDSADEAETSTEVSTEGTTEADVIGDVGGEVSEGLTGAIDAAKEIIEKNISDDVAANSDAATEE